MAQMGQNDPKCPKWPKRPKLTKWTKMAQMAQMGQDVDQDVGQDVDQDVGQDGRPLCMLILLPPFEVALRNFEQAFQERTATFNVSRAQSKDVRTT